MSGEAAAISIEGDVVVLDLGPFVDAAKQQLVDSGFTAAARIPQVHPTVDLFAASTLVRAQTTYRMLDAVASVRPGPKTCWRMRYGRRSDTVASPTGTLSCDADPTRATGLQV